MFISEPAYFIKSFLEELNHALLTFTQRTGLGFGLMGILLVKSVCWAKFERASLGGSSLSRLPWMFIKSKIAWTLLVIVSVKPVLKRHGITENVLVIDETDHRRAKRTKHLYKTHKQKEVVRYK